MQATQVCISRGMGKEDVAHIDSGMLLSHRKESNDAICSNTHGDLEMTIPSDSESRSAVSGSL